MSNVVVFKQLLFELQWLFFATKEDPKTFRSVFSQMYETAPKNKLHKTFPMALVA